MASHRPRGKAPLAAHKQPGDPRLVWWLFIQPQILEAVAIVGTVVLNRHVLDEGLPAGAGSGVEQDRPRDVLLEFFVDVPNQLLAFREIGLGRLFIEQLFQVLVAVVGIIALRPAGVIFIKCLIGIVPKNFTNAIRISKPSQKAGIDKPLRLITRNT